jgi:hypothetical protein
MESPINYRQDNTINLLASISNAISDTKCHHNELEKLQSNNIKNFSNIILFVIDWLPYSFLEKELPEILKNFENQIIHPVFPSATTPALTTLATAKTPQEHWLPWRFTFLKEIWVLTAILPFTARNWANIAEETDSNYFFDTQSIYEKSKRKNYIFNRDYLINSEYSKAFAKNATRIGCTNFLDICNKLKYIIKASNEKKYIYAYDPEFDSKCHEFWVYADITKNYAKKIFKSIQQLLEKLEGTNTLVLITADHWMIDSTPERNIKAEDYPEFKEMLSLPLSWETRAVFCHIKANEWEHFEQRIKKYFSEYCDCYKSSDLLANWWFWEWKIHEWFADRIWDYTLIMKENYILVDSILWQKREPILWNHWWTSKEELNIPLLRKKL